MLLAIGPLSLTGVYAVARTRVESVVQRQEALLIASDAAAAHFESWYQQQRAEIYALTPETLVAWPGQNRHGIWLFDNPTKLPGELVAELDAVRSGELVFASDGTIWFTLTDGAQPLLVQRPAPNLSAEPGTGLERLGSGTHIAIVTGEGVWCLDGGAEACPADELSQFPLSQNGRGPETRVLEAQGLVDEALLVAYQPLARSRSALLVVSQPREVAVRASENLAAALIATSLLAALLTTVIAAILTRQITRPVFELTRTVVTMARGDLSRRVPVTRRDELGILSIAFNAMAERLGDLLATLEQRVADRTAELQVAKAHIERRARQLGLSAELSRELAALKNLDEVLLRAPGLICSRFGYGASAIWLSRETAHGRHELFEVVRCRVGTVQSKQRAAMTQALVQQVAADELSRGTTTEGPAVPPTSGARLPILGLPLRLSAQLIGVLVLEESVGFDAGDSQALQTLADQLTIAIESARAAEIERTVADKLRELEQRRAASLGEMSHELSTALNSIIGFSRLMLKEVDGPLTEMQRSDLTFINRNGQQLLELLNGMLELVETDRDEVPSGNRETE